MRWPWLLRGRGVRLHWSLVAGILLVAALTRSGEVTAGYLALLGVHLAGHAALIRRAGLQPVGIDLHGLGGQVRWQGEGSPLQASRVALGGIGAQLAVYLLAWLISGWEGLPQEGPGSKLIVAAMTVNLWVIGLNFLPLPGSDAPDLWRLPGRLLQAMVDRLEAAAMDQKRQEWQAIIDADQAGPSGAAPIDRAAPPAAPRDAVAAAAFELSERDARADAGIPPEVADEVQRLLASALTAELREGDEK